MHNIKTSPIKHVAQRERECCKQMKKKRESGQEIDGIVSGTGSASLSSGILSLLYQHSGCVLQKGGLTHPGAQPKGQRILGGYAC